jgi:hypothetical protein
MSFDKKIGCKPAEAVAHGNLETSCFNYSCVVLRISTGYKSTFTLSSFHRVVSWFRLGSVNVFGRFCNGSIFGPLNSTRVICWQGIGVLGDQDSVL